MQCRNCGTAIADKALICYKCGTATTEAKYQPVARQTSSSRAGLVWTVVCDRVIVVAGRRYIAAATAPGAARPNMDDFMQPAVARGLWIASAAGGAVFLTGLACVRVAVQRAAGGRTGVRPQSDPSLTPVRPQTDPSATPARPHAKVIP